MSVDDLQAAYTRAITVTVNGQRLTQEVPVRLLLSDFLRQTLGLTGTHVGCEHGVCGACTVLLDGEPVRSCLLLTPEVDGHSLTTIEGIGGPSGGLHPLQESFRRHFALQCGFCTPGILLSLYALLAEEPKPDEATVREVLSGHLCRCTGYASILRAVAAVTDGEGKEP